MLLVMVIATPAAPAVVAAVVSTATATAVVAVGTTAAVPASAVSNSFLTSSLFPLLQVVIRLDPLTASDEDRKYVSLLLEIRFPPGYPDEAPQVEARSPRGLLDSSVATLLESLRARAEEFAASGAPVIFELVSTAISLTLEGCIF